MNFWKLFGVDTQDTTQNFGSLFSDLEKLLSGHSDAEIARITGLAGLLGKVAYSDREVSDDEITVIKEILTRETPISPSLFDALLEVLKRHTIELAGLEDHRYTRFLNDALTPQEKIAVVGSLFAVAAANDSISFAEDSAISLIAKGLRLSHEDFIAARRPYNDRLDVLQN